MVTADRVVPTKVKALGMDAVLLNPEVRRLWRRLGLFPLMTRLHAQP